MQTLIVMPTYNERENISSIVERIHSICPEVDILIVDDNSPDGTGNIADDMAVADSRVQVIHREGKLGLGTAYIAGFKYALRNGYDRIIEMDADFSHRPEDLPRLIDASKRADVVIGSRIVPGGMVENWSLLRKAISRGGSFYARLMLGLPVSDCTAGFKCFRREVLEALDLDQVKSNGYAFQVEMNFLCHCGGFRIEEIPVTFPDRTNGHSKMSRGIVIEAASRVIELRRRGIPVASEPSRSSLEGARIPDAPTTLSAEVEMVGE